MATGNKHPLESEEVEKEVYANITITGYLAKFIKMQREGYKVFVQPLQVNSLDLIFKRIEKIDLCAVQLALGSKNIELHKAFFDSSLDLDRFFSSGHVKNGVLFNLKKLEVASLADILNYNDVMQNQESTIDSDKEVQRFAHTLEKDKETFLNAWAFLNSLPPISLQPSTSAHEHNDKHMLTTIITTFSPKPIFIFQEIPLNAVQKSIPHGSLDLLVVSERSSTQTTIGFLCINDLPSNVVMGSSVKTESTLDKVGSERQAVLELLTLAQCAEEKDCIYILLLANRNHFIPFFYYPENDLLLRTSKSLCYEGESGIDGCFLLFFLFRQSQYLSKKRLIDLATLMEEETKGSSRCGWQSAIAKSSPSFNNSVSTKKTGQPTTQSRTQPSSSSIKLAMATKRRKFVKEL